MQNLTEPRSAALQPIADRRISDRAFLGHYALAVALGLAIAVGLFLTGQGLFAPAALLPFAGVWVYAYLSRLSHHYRLFDDRIEVESGIISRRIENIELFRVRDVGLSQGLLGKMANFGDIYIHSTDSSTPDVHVTAIDDPRHFYQVVRDAVGRSRAQHKTMIVEGSQGFPEG